MIHVAQNSSSPPTTTQVQSSSSTSTSTTTQAQSCDSSSTTALPQIQKIEISMSTEEADSNTEDGGNHYGTRGQPQEERRGRGGRRGHGGRGGNSKKRSYEFEEQQAKTPSKKSKT
ncbi:hypothetical protein INT45_000515 [Circinella minor]|uniref:Uncharacterized protein n=1 Tax=Circinella minor TaxID=1195481 RepID=A0A8H7VJU2_9FUNG|nr:hypothetical protein INT45_000515 [Circinella minor]